MPAMWWVVGVVALVVLVATYLTWIAARVDRLHQRAAGAFAALDAHLVRRAATAGAVADRLPASEATALRDAARGALAAHPEEREAAENDLTRLLRGVPRDDDVVAVCRRVALARQVHNDVVRDALAVRRRKVVRLLRLARKHPVPAYFDVDDPALDDSVARPAPSS